MRRYIFLLLVCATLWGIYEFAVGGWLYGHHIPKSSVYLTAGALLLLGMSMRLPIGSGAIISALAMLFKFMNHPFYACHMVAIFLIGVSYDISRILWRRYSSRNYYPVVVGFSTGYLSAIMFSLTITYLVQHPHWVGGLPQVINYIGVQGTMFAIAGTVMVPLGVRLYDKVYGWRWIALHRPIGWLAISLPWIYSIVRLVRSFG